MNAPLGRCIDCLCGSLQADSPIGRKDLWVSWGPEDAERTVEMFARIVSHSLRCRARWISAAVTTEVHRN